jgi:hypothetical protein
MIAFEVEDRWAPFSCYDRMQDGVACDVVDSIGLQYKTLNCLFFPPFVTQSLLERNERSEKRSDRESERGQLSQNNSRGDITPK